MHRSRTHAPRALAAAAAVLLGAGLAACSDDGDDQGGEPTPTTVVGSGSTYEATIVRTTDGVPHITGATLADAAFGQGYASGEDRTCDLADQVVKIRGERSRWLGAGDDDEHLNSDVQWRAIGIFDLALDDWEALEDETTSLFEAFVAGWNAHLEEVGVDGLAGWCAGEPWVRPLEPAELYAYARSVALNASGTRVGAFIPTAQPPDAAGEEGDDADATEEPANAVGPTAPDAPSGAGSTAAPTGSIGGLADAPIASNGWAIGAERSATGGGMLVGNPHFPWEGELRFWESHLTVPGEVDAYGVQLSGLPGIGIGFTEGFGWTHTVSAGNRFTAYTLDLVPGSPTTYRYGDEEREMEAREHTIEVLGDDGELTEVTRTTWHSHYGPVIDFPGYGWTETGAITYRDANIDNDEFVLQYFAMLQAKTLDDFIAAHEEHNGVPLFNTIATSADGRAWYADTSATPNLSDEALAAYEERLRSDSITSIAADNGAILLDGSDPTFEWVEAEGARDPGLVPFSEQPQIELDDYVFNANDSFWVPHATERIEGDLSPLHGRQETARSPRTRENAVVLDDATAEGASGDDGAFTLDELADAALANRGYTSRALLDEVVERCEGAPPVDLLPLLDDDGEEVLPAEEVDIAEACDVLAGWDGVYDLDRAGPPLWRELMSRYEFDDLTEAGALWAEPFDPADPIGTPAGLAPPSGEGDVDLALEHLARAVQILALADMAPDVTLGEAQFAERDGEIIPIHGGGAFDGTTNIVGFGSGHSILDPALDDVQRDLLVPGSSLADVGDGTGYPINNGTSFLLALAYGDDGPEAKVFLTYGNTEDRSAESYTEATQRFSAKDWRPVAFTSDAVDADASSRTTVRG